LNYKKIYNNLCNSRKSSDLNKELGYEIHHIVPRSCGGSDNDSNLVKFTYKEHFLAHKLLVKIYRGTNHHYKMTTALWCMAKLTDKLHKMITSREFSYIRKLYYNNGFQELRKQNSCGDLLIKDRVHPYINFTLIHMLSKKVNNIYSKKLCSSRFNYEYLLENNLHSYVSVLVAFYNLGYNGVGCINKNRDKLLQLGVFIEEEINGGKRILLFTEEFLEWCGRVKMNIITTKLSEMLSEGNKKNHKFYRYILCWNDFNKDKLITMYTDKNGYVYIAPISNWNLNDKSLISIFNKKFKSVPKELKDFYKNKYEGRYCKVKEG
jgi:hypothetical protein